jgi:hypothetical protein
VPDPLVRAVPVALLVGSAWAMAWMQHGSIDAGDWLGYALLGGLVLATVLLSGTAALPPRRALIGLSFLVALAAWAAVSSTWSPVPSLARDEGLLVAFYAIAFLVPLLTLRTSADRLAATAVLVAAMATLAVATAAELRFADKTLELFDTGRLSFPIAYANGQAALYLIAFWPALMLASRRSLNVFVRALSVAAATAVLAGWLLTQSKGAAIGLAFSALALFALFPARLRIFVPVLIPAALIAIAWVPLTEPYRTETDPALRDAIRHGGTTLLWLTAVGAGAGLLYALVDRRLALPRRVRRAAGAAVLALLLAGAVAGVAAFFTLPDDPGGVLERQWRTFKARPNPQTTSTHLLSIGSNRYDFWRVSLGELREHPVAGDGGRSFGPVYLQKRRSSETPARAHSLVFEVLMEEGIVGLLLLAGAVLVPLWLAARRARRGALSAAGAFAGGVYWLVHASGDWIWTIPAAGVPLFCLLGIGASPRGTVHVRTRTARLAATAALVVTVLAFTPVWLSARLTERGLERSSLDDLRWAQRLDPLSVQPLLAKATLAPTPEEQIPPLEDALAKEPRSAAIHFLLGEAYLAAGRRQEAVRQLEAALRLSPLDRFIRATLDRARG